MKNRMWKNVVIFFLLVCVYPLHAQEKYVAPELSDQDSWSMVLIPDPQTYVKFARNQGILNLMTAWVSENVEKLNIGFVMCTGDMVEQNDLLNPNGKAANQNSPQQWQAVSSAFGRLDGVVPYIVTTGNHDFGILSAENRRTHFDEYFTPNKNILNKKILRDVGLTEEGVPTLRNATYEYITPQGKKILILVLEFAPRDAAIEWAKGIVSQDKYKDHEVILLTHSYMNSDNEHIVKEGYKVADANYGAAIWEKLVKPSTNIRMVFAGHIGAPDNEQKHIAFRTDTNAAGKKVQQMVFNAQALGGGWHGNGGDGWLRILEFLPDGKTVKVKTFSPLFAISPSTQNLAWRKAAYDEFTFTLD
ncbi:metallophosphoesterase [Massilibacteroides sp.]|uniref:metallophosphoesterase n=1 Tax=Massilibacteroides sp. TaxID=2034766 RepID=UPI00263A1BC1|nr:metallophosphoesterase [Massilibacteroides sp.]MDD4515192.1 metallophosphoesterase [Massilibacteroides sp.]